jgi:serine/threonine-protein kinase
MALQIAGDPAAADAALQNVIAKYGDGNAFQIAEIYALRKQPEPMFEWLERAWSNRDPGISYLLYDPFLTAYRHDPRFAAFCGKVGLPPPPTRQ